MKKICVIFMMVLLSLSIFVGCGNSKDNFNTITKTEGQICADLLPDPNDYFENANITTEIESRCYYYITNYQDGEYDSYMSALQEEGNFPIIHYDYSSDTGKTYLAYDANKEHYLQIYFSYEQKGITIECHATESSTDEINETED